MDKFNSKEHKLVELDLNILSEQNKDTNFHKENFKSNEHLNKEKSQPSRNDKILSYNQVNNNINFEYENFTIKYLLELENKYKLSNNFLKFLITPKMRAMVIDWLNEVQHYFLLGGETLFLSVKILDQFIDKYPVQPSDLQLSGIVALWMTNKYWNRSQTLEVKIMLNLCKNVYSSDEFLKMENKIIRVINFNFNYAEPLTFVNYYSQKINISKNVLNATNYFLDLILMKEKYSKKKDSVLAAGALYSAVKILEPFKLINIKKIFEEYYFTSEEIFQDILIILNRFRNDKYELRGAFNKYKSKLYNKISQKLLEFI